MRKKLMIPMVVFTLVVWAMTVSAQSAIVSLQEAVKLALEQDIGQKVALLNWESAKIAYEKSIANNLLTESTYNARTAELNRMKAEGTYWNSIADVVIAAVTRFSDLKQMELDIKVREQEYALSKRQLELARKKMTTGNASELDVLQAEASEGTSASNFQKAKDDFAEQMRDFALMIGREDFTLGEGPVFVPFTVDLNTILDEAVSDSVTVKERSENVVLAELEYEQLKLEGAAELLLREAEIGLELARLQLQQSIEDVKNNVTSAFKSVGHALKSYELSLKNYEIELRKYQITQKQVTAGLKTRDDLVNAQISLWQAEKSRDNALKNYLVSYLQFEKLIGKDLRTSAVLKVPQTASN